MPTRRPRLVAALALGGLAAVGLGCSKKLSTGGSPIDAIAYDLLGMERGTAYYYDVVLNAHDKKTFHYRTTDDPYLADKCVDAIVHLGDASYARLEGEVQVVLLLSDVLSEDPSALAKNVAAGSLTRLALKLPEVPGPRVPERGDRYLKLLQELDAAHDPATGRRLNDTEATKRRVAQVVEEIGNFEFPSPVLERDGLRFFPARKYVTEETDPTLRDVFDRAMVRRSRSLILASLQGAVLDPVPHVRQAAVQGLKTLGAAQALDAVAERVPEESHPWVRAEIAEYLGAIGGPKAAAALLPMIDDVDGSVRHKARLALTRLAGQDLGGDRRAWQAWVERRFPAPASSAAAPAPANPDAAGPDGAPSAPPVGR
jgi:hypothetical protein